MSTHAKVSISDQVAEILFFEENERKPCTIDWNVLDELEKIFDEIEKSEVRAVLVKSASKKSFSVGANIAVLQTLNAENIQTWVRTGHRVFDRLQTMRIPTIACVESYALGGGLEIAMACDMIIATENAKFAQPEASLGVMPGWGGSLRLAERVGKARAKEMFYTGEQITAQTAYEWGLVNHVCAAENLVAFISEMVEKIKENDSQVQALTKEILNSKSEGERLRNAGDEAITSSVCMNSETTKQRMDEFFRSRQKK